MERVELAFGILWGGTTVFPYQRILDRKSLAVDGIGDCLWNGLGSGERGAE